MKSLKTFVWTTKQQGNKSRNNPPGSGVGARSRAVRRAIILRASNCCPFADISKLPPRPPTPPGSERTITFEQNPLRIFNDPCGDFPIFTRSSFEQWVSDISDSGNEGTAGFTDASLNFIISFDSEWEVIGTNVLKDLSNLNVKTNTSLTDTFKFPGSLVEISGGAFFGLGLSGELDFTNFTKLAKIGEDALTGNNFSGSLKFVNDPSLSAIEQNAFKGSPFDGDLIFRNVPRLDINPADIVDLNGFLGNLEINNTGFTEITQDFSNGTFEGNLAIANNPALASIKAHAFSGASFKGLLTLQNLPALTNIHDNAFNSNEFIGDLVLKDLPLLDNIETFAFYNAGFNGVFELKNAPLLRRIGGRCFQNCGLVGSLEISDLPSLNFVGGGAFEANNFNQSLRIVNCPSLTTLEVDAFKDNSFANDFVLRDVPNLDISNVNQYPDLTTFTGNLEFNNTGIKEITDDFSNGNFTGSLTIKDNQDLTSIQSNAFKSNSFTGSLAIKNNPLLQNINLRTFQKCKFTKLELSGLDSLEEIGFETFFSNNFQDGVTFTNCPKLKKIKGSAFIYSKIRGELDFSGLTSLETIGNNSFQECKFNNRVKFGNCPSLNTIQNIAFFDSEISGVVDFSGLTALTSIGNEAFKDNPNITEFRFFDNSGCTLGSDVYLQLDGETSIFPGIPGLEWKNTGFTIPTSDLYIWEVSP